MGFARAALVISLVLFPAIAYGGHHNFSAYAAYSLADNGSSGAGGIQSATRDFSTRAANSVGNGHGWQFSGEVALKAPESQPYRFGFVADISGHAVGGSRKWDATQFTVLVGPRFSFRPVIKQRANFFAHVMLFGGIHRSDSVAKTSVTTQALAFGGGVDVTYATEGHLGLRLQYDRIVAGTGIENTNRYSVGVVYLFHD